MSLHRLTTAVVGVPDPEACGAFYADFGLTPIDPGRFATTDGGEQLRLEQASRRHLVELGVGVDDADDLDRLEQQLRVVGVGSERDGDALVALDPPTGVRVRVEVAPRLAVATRPVVDRPDNTRSPAVERTGPVRPRKLGHVVLGSPDAAATRRLFIEGLGFAVSDEITGFAAFLRCSTDHHNLLVQQAPQPMLHHTSWMVDDADEVGRGGSSMVAADPERHLWGLGRHHIGSNWFWYLRDPAGNFAEYYADLDVITDPDAWQAGSVADHRALYAWAPPVPADFLAPPDLAEAAER